MRQFIYLEPKDNIATIRAKLARAQANEVVLVLPSHFEVLRSLVNLKLLKRQAQNLAIDLALVVRDGETRVLAREAGLTLTSSVERGQTIPLRRRRKRPPLASIARRRGRDQAGLAAPRESPLARMLALLFVLALLTGLGAAFIYWVLPSAVVTLVPATRPLEAAMEIVAVPGIEDVDYGQGRVPAQIVSVELSGTANTPATGKRDIPDAHAEGYVVFANKTNGPVIIPKNTIVRTSAGAPIRFYTVTDLELPPTWGAHGRVSIIAVEPGPSGNVKRLTINVVEGEAAFQVDVINDEPTRGGSLKRVSEVTQEDIGRVKNTLLQRLHQEAYAKLQTQLSEGTFIPASTVNVKILEESYDREAGAIADNLNLLLRVRATGTVVGGEEANILMLRMLESKLPAGYVLQRDSLRFQPGEVLATEGVSVRFVMQASGLATSDIDPTEVRRRIAGKPEAEAMQYLLDAFECAKPPTLQLAPEWLGRVPWIPYRITVKIEAPPAQEIGGQP